MKSSQLGAVMSVALAFAPSGLIAASGTKAKPPDREFTVARDGKIVPARVAAIATAPAVGSPDEAFVSTGRGPAEAPSDLSPSAGKPAAAAPVAACPNMTLGREEVRSLIYRIAGEEKFDARLTEAVARAESELGKVMVSPKGAVGIMQIMPDTAKDYGISDRCDPEQSIRGGIRFLKDLMAEFDNNVMLALGAYNAGRTRIYDHRGVPVWNETAKYVVKVLNFWQDFDSKLGQRRGRKVAAAQAELADEPAVPTSSKAQDRWVDGHVINVETR